MEEAAVVAKLDQAWRARMAAHPCEQLKEWRQRERHTEHRLTIPTTASQHLLALVCARFGLRVYRRPRLRSSTLCVEAPAGFVREVLWPVFETMAHIIEDAADATTSRIMQQWSRGEETLA
jgi:hypothetical protein